MAYEFLDHTGDTAVEIRATDGEDLFRQAAAALLDILVDQRRGAPVGVSESLPVELEAEDGESLLIDFLNELIFLFDSRRYLCSTAEWQELRLDPPSRLRGVLRGETFDERRHVSLTEVKAATFHEIEIERSGAGLKTTVVFDL